MEYIENSQEIVGYNVKIMKRAAFKITGYTLIVPPGPDNPVPQFWSSIVADGKLEALKQASAVPPWTLGLGSWDPECEKGGHRYTICIEETEHTEFAQLAQEHDIFTRYIGASDWMCFEIATEEEYLKRFWKDNPYKMLKKMGYQFHTGDYGIGLHFEAYPPDHDYERNPMIEFWITVKRP